MTRRYLVLFAVIVAAAVVLALVRGPKSQAHDLARSAMASATSETLLVTVSDSAFAPALASVPEGSRVWLIVRNRGTAPVQLALAGYEERLQVPRLEPGVAWSGSFTAELPGDDFAWLVEGKPVARFRVTGSHLVEGHR